MSDSSKIAAPQRPELFSVECTTCKARLKVRSAAAIGQILSCPKCQSMVLVAAPAGWTPDAPPAPETPVAAEANTVATAGAAVGSNKIVWIAAGVATLVCSLGVVAVWRQFRTEPPSAVAVADPPAPTPPVIEETPESPLSEVPAEELPAAETPDVPIAEPETPPPAAAEEPAAPAAPFEAPAPEVVATETAVEPEPAPATAPPAAPAPEVTPPLQDVSTSGDVLRRLQVRVAGIDEPSIRLDALAKLLGGLAACPITLDDTSLAAVELSGTTTTTLKVEAVSIEAALTAALEPLGLEFEPRGKAIVIFAPAK